MCTSVSVRALSLLYNLLTKVISVLGWAGLIDSGGNRLFALVVIYLWLETCVSIHISSLTHTHTHWGPQLSPGHIKIDHSLQSFTSVSNSMFNLLFNLFPNVVNNVFDIHALISNDFYSSHCLFVRFGLPQRAGWGHLVWVSGLPLLFSVCCSCGPRG